jgi:hypothetical protein
MMKMSSFMKLRIIDYELCVCEYGLSSDREMEETETSSTIVAVSYFLVYGVAGH